MKKILFSMCLLVLTICFCACLSLKNEIKVEFDNGIVIVDLGKNTLEPFVSENLSTNKQVFKDNKFTLSMNAGYFDTVNKQTTSYVVMNGKTVLDPTTNKNLINNPKLQEGMDRILNRSELRYLDCPFEKKYVIQKHFDELEDGCSIINSVQAGPMLLPKMDLEEEYFISKDEKGQIIRDPIGVSRRAPRIAVGINNVGGLVIFAATTKHPMTLEELASYMSKKGIAEAINFDGGGSVSLNYKEIDIFSDYKNTRRPVKSFLIVR